MSVGVAKATPTLLYILLYLTFTILCVGLSLMPVSSLYFLKTTGL